MEKQNNELVSIEQVEKLVDNLIQDIYPYLYGVDVEEVYEIIKKNKDKYLN